jgi:hypothetical protein
VAAAAGVASNEAASGEPPAPKKRPPVRIRKAEPSKPADAANDDAPY